MPSLHRVCAFAFAALFLAASARPAAAQPPSLTGIEFAPDGSVTVRGAGTAGARYDLYRTDGLGALPPWGEAVGSGLAGTNGQFAVEDSDPSTAPAGFYCVSEKAVVHRKVQLWADGPYWAETNVGAEEPWEYGFYFWWGDTVGYRRVGNAWVANDGSTDNFSFLPENTPSSNMKHSELKAEGWLTEDNVLTPAHDAAHVHWGGGWRIPTHDELNDLCNNKCDWSQATTNGVNGFRVRGRGSFAGASIFLPAVGSAAGNLLSDAGWMAYYWSSYAGKYNYYGDYLRAYNEYHEMFLMHRARYSGHTIRPVQSP